MEISKLFSLLRKLFLGGVFAGNDFLGGIGG